MRTMIRTWGNSLAIRIPKAFAIHLGMFSGKEVELSLEKNALRIVSPTENLDMLLARVHPSNLHGEVFDDPPQGREVW